MIYDTFEHAACYPYGPAFQKAVEFAKQVNADTALGRHEIDGDRIFANVMEYETEDKAPAKYEIHRRYADFQVVVAGHETLFVRPAAGLPVQTPYDAEKDCGFLSPGDQGDEVNVQLFPGYFTLIFPQDAHMGKGATCRGPVKLKKVVVKIALDALRS